MNQAKKTLCFLLAAALLAACAPRTEDAGPQEGTSSLQVEVVEAPDLLAQWDAVYDQMNRDQLPLRGADSYAALDGFDGGTQLAMEDETAKKLASAVYNLLDAYGNGLGSNYTGGDELSMARTTTALWHTAPIDFTWEVSREGAFTCDNSNHVLAALVKRELDSGRTPVALYYGSQVRDTAQRLFGSDARITNMDEHPYYYYEKEGVYILMEAFEQGHRYIPQILNYEKTETGYKAEAILADEIGGKLEIGGQPLTKENISQLAAEVQHLRYTFREESGFLVLETLETWRPDKT